MHEGDSRTWACNSGDLGEQLKDLLRSTACSREKEGQDDDDGRDDPADDDACAQDDDALLMVTAVTSVLLGWALQGMTLT